jgi:DNA-binding NarL/FixJ family response regulator
MTSQGESEEILLTSKPLLGKRVVLCEDEVLIAASLRKALIRFGFDVVETVNSGEAAVEVVLREKPDIVLMDIQLNGMDGLKAVQQIMHTNPTCVVIMSAYSDPAAWDEAWAVGATGFLQKPVFSEVVVETLGNAWDRFNEGYS